MGFPWEGSWDEKRERKTTQWKTTQRMQAWLSQPAGCEGELLVQRSEGRNKGTCPFQISITAKTPWEKAEFFAWCGFAEKRWGGRSFFTSTSSSSFAWGLSALYLGWRHTDFPLIFCQHVHGAQVENNSKNNTAFPGDIAASDWVHPLSFFSDKCTSFSLCEKKNKQTRDLHFDCTCVLIGNQMKC